MILKITKKKKIEKIASLIKKKFVWGPKVEYACNNSLWLKVYSRKMGIIVW